MRRPGVLIIVLAVAFAIGGTLFSLLSRKSAPPLAESTAPAAQDAISAGGAEISGARVIQRDATGAVEWELEADGALEYDRQAQRIRGHGVHWRFVRAGQPGIEVKAASFVGDYAGQSLEFDKGVVITTPDGAQRFDAARVTYHFDTRTLTAQRISARRGAYTVAAARGEVDIENSTLRMSGGVRMARS